MNKTYTITRINNNEVDHNNYARLCPICHKHLIIDSIYNYNDGGTDTAFLDQLMCTTCSYRFRGLYSAKIGEYSFFDGFLDIVTAELIPACNFPPKDFIYIPLSEFKDNIVPAYELESIDDINNCIDTDGLPF